MKIIFFLSIIFYKLTYGYINIYPTKFEEDITKGVRKKFILYNRTDEEIKYRIYLEPGQGEDMSQWMEVYPKSLTLNPLEEKEIRVSIVPPKTAEEGEYKSKFIVKEIGIPRKKIEDKVKFMTIFKLNMTGYIRRDENEDIK